MKPTNQTPSRFAKAVSGFANTAAALVSFLLIPLIAPPLREWMEHHLSTMLGTPWTVWGSWAFIVILGLAVYFGLSAFLHIGVMILFRAGTTRPRGL